MNGVKKDWTTYYTKMRFIDLFAGLGGFHVALSSLGHECVFTCEINDKLAELYERNFGISAHKDIRQIKESDIPPHDIFCAGFPCQPFSKAGYQEGRNDVERGTLFDEIARILRYHRPKYFILENVPNLKYHNNGNTWSHIIDLLEKQLKYEVKTKTLSPHYFGIPQIRERIFIIGCKSGLGDFNWPLPKEIHELSIGLILDTNPPEAKKVPDREMECLEVWQEFLDRIPKSVKLPSFPIWSMEFGATYPFKEKTPHMCTSKELDNYLGEFGASLYGMSKQDKLERIPKYARQKEKNFPKWKQDFISQNRVFYSKFKEEIDPILPQIMKFPTSWQKFEWNCQGEERDLKNFILQFRSSGLRVKRPNYSPSLISCTSTQIPIIGWENRYMTVKEGSRLQSLERLEMPQSETNAFRALGNAVNAKIVYLIAKSLIQLNNSESEKRILDFQSKAKTCEGIDAQLSL